MEDLRQAQQVDGHVGQLLPQAGAAPLPGFEGLAHLAVEQEELLPYIGDVEAVVHLVLVDPLLQLAPIHGHRMATEKLYAAFSPAGSRVMPFLASKSSPSVVRVAQPVQGSRHT